MMARVTSIIPRRKYARHCVPLVCEVFCTCDTQDNSHCNPQHGPANSFLQQRCSQDEAKERLQEL